MCRLAFLVVGSLFATQASAQDISLQPLTRAECDKAAMEWDENRNVCSDANAKKVESPTDAEPVVDVSSQPLTRLECNKASMRWDESANVCQSRSEAVTSRQPLTRDECDKAGMRWLDNANVCGEKPGTNQGVPAESNTSGFAIVINIDKTNQRMRVVLRGVEKYKWPVSTGRPSYFTPSGSYKATSMNEVWYSKEWDDAPMPHSIFFTKDGHAIHGSYEVKKLGRPASHGCVRISPKNAATLYALVAKNGIRNTQVVLTGSTPGGEGKVASSASSQTTSARKSRNVTSSLTRYRPAKAATSARLKSRYVRVTPRTFRDSPPRRRGLFGRRFGGAYYNYYQPPPAYYRRRGY